MVTWVQASIAVWEKVEHSSRNVNLQRTSSQSKSWPNRHIMSRNVHLFVCLLFASLQGRSFKQLPPNIRWHIAAIVATQRVHAPLWAMAPRADAREVLLETEVAGGATVMDASLVPWRTFSVTSSGSPPRLQVFCNQSCSNFTESNWYLIPTISKESKTPSYPFQTTALLFMFLCFEKSFAKVKILDFMYKVELFQKFLFLGGGNSNIFYVYPDPWGNDPIWQINVLAMGWKPPTSFRNGICLERGIPREFQFFAWMFVQSGLTSQGWMLKRSCVWPRPLPIEKSWMESGSCLKVWSKWVG